MNYMCIYILFFYFIFFFKKKNKKEKLRIYSNKRSNTVYNFCGSFALNYTSVSVSDFNFSG
jgi:hypothetical protein